MSYTEPTAADLIARFPAFSAVSTDVITDALAECAAFVSATVFLTESDFRLARMLYAAHTMTLDGLGTGTEAQLAQSGMLGFQSITSGRLSVSRAADGSSGSGSAHGSTLDQTQYGKRYREVLYRNNGGPIAGSVE